MPRSFSVFLRLHFPILFVACRSISSNLLTMSINLIIRLRVYVCKNTYLCECITCTQCVRTYAHMQTVLKKWNFSEETFRMQIKSLMQFIANNHEIISLMGWCVSKRNNKTINQYGCVTLNKSGIQWLKWHSNMQQYLMNLLKTPD